LGAAEPLRQEIGCPLRPGEQPHHDRQVEAAPAVRGDDPAFDRAWQGGDAMALEAAIACALEGMPLEEGRIGT